MSYGVILYSTWVLWSVLIIEHDCEHFQWGLSFWFSKISSFSCLLQVFSLCESQWYAIASIGGSSVLDPCYNYVIVGLRFMVNNVVFRAVQILYTNLSKTWECSICMWPLWKIKWEFLSCTWTLLYFLKESTVLDNLVTCTFWNEVVLFLIQLQEMYLAWRSYSSNYSLEIYEFLFFADYYDDAEKLAQLLVAISPQNFLGLEVR